MSDREAALRYALANPDWTVRQLDRLQSERSLVAFVRLAWPVIEPSQPYAHGRHIDAIAEHLEAVTDGEITRLLINVPPGFMKSLLTSVFWPAWEWGPVDRPATRIIGSSYSERYSIRDAARMRNLVMSEWYQDRWGDRVKLVKSGERKFETSATGWREAIPFSGLTGGRGDRLIIDDPHSTEDAESDADRERAKRIFLESVPTRLNDPERSAIVIIMQRLHQDDVSGIALSKDLGYEHLMLPMEYDSSRHCSTSIGFEDWRTEDGELLFPERFPRKIVEQLKVPLGPFGVAGQFQQSPEPRGGGIIKRHWWQSWGDAANPADWRNKKFPACEHIIGSLDTAYGEKEQNDYSALTVWGLWRDEAGRPRLMLMNAWKERLDLNDLVQRSAATCRKFKIDRLLVESKASGMSVAQELRRQYSGEGWGVQLVNVPTDKVARLYSVQHLFSDGIVYAPDRDWADMVIDEVSAFPNASHDDLVDSVTQALRYFRETGLVLHGVEIDRRDQEARTYRRVNNVPLYGGI